MRGSSWGSLFALALLTLFGWQSHASAGKANDTLVVAWDEVQDTLDPYFNQSAEMINLADLIFDSLILRDPDTFGYKPGLATSWKWVDDLTLELELRQGVKFHDGQPFDADDVVYTINTILSPDTKLFNRSTVGWMKSAEKIDQFKVRIHLQAPFPAALEYLAGPIWILPHEYAKTGLQGLKLNPIGTGPYKVAKADLGKEIVLERSDGTGPRGSPSIGKVIIRPITQKTTQMAEFLAGKIDWMYYVPTDQSTRMQSLPDVQVTSGETMRVVYIFPDAAARSGKSPLQDVRVRRAMAYAINREELARVIYGPAAKVLLAPCYRLQFGCYQGAPQYEYNVQKAKQLLAEAGYPDGFDTQLYSYLSTQFNDAAAGYLRAVGIRARIAQQPYLAFHRSVLDGITPMNAGGWASTRINDGGAILGALLGGSGEDYARDPQVMAWVTEAGKVSDPKVREEKYKLAVERVMDQALFLPISTATVSYVARKSLEFKVYPDEKPRYNLYKWK